MTEAEPVDFSITQVAALFSEPAVLEEMDARLPIGLHRWEADVVQHHFPPPGRVLDLGCGPGREALALTRIGYEVVGADMSEAVLDRARANAAQAGVTVRWALVDGVNVPRGPFDTIVMWAQVIGNIERRRDQLALIGNCRGALRPGGIISASGHYAPYCRSEWGTQTEGNWFYPTGSWQAGKLRYHMFTAGSLERLFREAGFTVIATEVPETLPAIVHTVGRRDE